MSTEDQAVEAALAALDVRDRRAPRERWKPGTIVVYYDYDRVALVDFGGSGTVWVKNSTDRPYRPGQRVYVRFKPPRGAEILGLVGQNDVPVIRAEKTVAQPILENSYDIVVWDSIVFDAWDMSGGGAPLIVAVLPSAGVYKVTATMLFAARAGTSFQISVQIEDNNDFSILGSAYGQTNPSFDTWITATCTTEQYEGGLINVNFAHTVDAPATYGPSAGLPGYRSSLVIDWISAGYEL